VFDSDEEEFAKEGVKDSGKEEVNEFLHY